jgi:hypothetical protein
MTLQSRVEAAKFRVEDAIFSKGIVGSNVSAANQPQNFKAQLNSGVDFGVNGPNPDSSVDS